MKPRGVNNMQESGKNDVSMLEENVSTGNQQLTETENSTEALDQREPCDPNVDPTVDQEPPTADLVAGTDESGFTSVVPEEVQPEDKLADLMKLSREMSESFGIEPQRLTDEEWIRKRAEQEDGSMVFAGSLVLPTAEEVAAVTDGKLAPLLKLDRTTGEVTMVAEGIGQQPDGTFKLVVTIAEGYFEGIKSQAESDGVTPEEWVSTRLGDYMEQWWFGRG
jgi:hypothetical protein